MPSLAMRGEQTVQFLQPFSMSGFTTSYSAFLLEGLQGEHSGRSRTGSEQGRLPPKIGILVLAFWEPVIWPLRISRAGSTVGHLG